MFLQWTCRELNWFSDVFSDSLLPKHPDYESFKVLHGQKGSETTNHSRCCVVKPRMFGQLIRVSLLVGPACVGSAGRGPEEELCKA